MKPPFHDVNHLLLLKQNNKKNLDNETQRVESDEGLKMYLCRPP
jgi:hypothetical protein